MARERTRPPVPPRRSGPPTYHKPSRRRSFVLVVNHRDVVSPAPTEGRTAPCPSSAGTTSGPPPALRRLPPHPSVHVNPRQKHTLPDSQQNSGFVTPPQHRTGSTHRALPNREPEQKTSLADREAGRTEPGVGTRNSSDGQRGLFPKKRENYLRSEGNRESTQQPESKKKVKLRNKKTTKARAGPKRCRHPSPCQPPPFLTPGYLKRGHPASWSSSPHP